MYLLSTLFLFRLIKKKNVNDKTIANKQYRKVTRATKTTKSRPACRSLAAVDTPSANTSCNIAVSQNWVLLINQVFQLIIERTMIPWQRGVTGEIVVFVRHIHVKHLLFNSISLNSCIVYYHILYIEIYFVSYQFIREISLSEINPD
jgi:hypothetical protein